MISNKLFLILNVILIGGISCQTWPTFHLYNRAGVGTQVNAATLASTPGYDPSQELKLVIHGFGSSQDSPSIRIIRDALLSKTSANVIIVDWKDGATSPNYFTAAPNTKTVGARTAAFLKDLGVHYSKIHCIGHSLGAHACGFTGKNFKLGRITGLDPAGPLFSGTAPAKRLAVGDADLVDCSHTDSSLGIQENICDKNYYPNGGKFQVGCPTLGYRRDIDPTLYVDPANYDNQDQYELDTMVYHLKLTPYAKDETDIVGCSHNRAPQYFAESVNRNCGFTSTPCNSFTNFQNGLCKCSATYGCCSMGYCSNQSPEKGDFHLETNTATPFSKH